MEKMFNLRKFRSFDDRAHVFSQSELREVEDKFRKAMVGNAQLDNEKASAVYQVELYKDRYEELEEDHNQLQVSASIIIVLLPLFSMFVLLLQQTAVFS